MPAEALLAQSSTFHLLFGDCCCSSSFPFSFLLLLLWSLLWHKFHFKKHKIRARVFLAIPFIWFTISLNQLMDTLRSSPRSATITRTVLSFYLSLPVPVPLPSAAPADHLSLSVQVTGRQTPTNYVYGQTAASCNQVAGTRKLGLRMLF